MSIHFLEVGRNNKVRRHKLQSNRARRHKAENRSSSATGQQSGDHAKEKIIMVSMVTIRHRARKNGDIRIMLKYCFREYSVPSRDSGREHPGRPEIRPIK